MSLWLNSMYSSNMRKNTTVSVQHKDKDDCVRLYMHFFRSWYSLLCIIRVLLKPSWIRSSVSHCCYQLRFCKIYFFLAICFHTEEMTMFCNVEIWNWKLFTYKQSNYSPYTCMSWSPVHDFTLSFLISLSLYFLLIFLNKALKKET